MRRLFTRLVAGLVRRRAAAGDRALALFWPGRAATAAGSRDAVDVTGLFLCDLSACDGDDLIGD
jgi:hypothetical protein